MSSPANLALPHVAKLHAYTPGLQPNEAGWVKLNTNECPYPPSPKVAEALRTEIGAAGESLRLYPNPTSAALRRVVGNVRRAPRSLAARLSRGPTADPDRWVGPR